MKINWVLLCIFLAGCANVAVDNNTSIIQCENGYTAVNGMCCIDTNADNICDENSPITAPKANLDNIKDYLVRISWKTNKSMDATGFFVSDKGHILTSWGMIKEYIPEGCYQRVGNGNDSNFIKVCTPEFKVIDTDSNTFINHTLVAYNENFDIAIIKIDETDLDLIRMKTGKTFSPLEFGEAKAGDQAYSFYFEPSLKIRPVELKIENERYLQRGVKTYKTNDSFNSREYGMPIVTKDMKIVGMSSFGVNNETRENSLIINPEALKRFTEDALTIRCYPSCPVIYERSSEVVKIYKPKYVLTGRNKIDNTPESNEVYFTKFTIDMNNDDNTEHNICFDARVIKNGILVHTAQLSPKVNVKARIKSTREIKVNWYDDTSSGEKDQDYYFEVTASDCDTKDEYNKFYLRGKY